MVSCNNSSLGVEYITTLILKQNLKFLSHIDSNLFIKTLCIAISAKPENLFSTFTVKIAPSGVHQLGKINVNRTRPQKTMIKFKSPWAAQKVFAKSKKVLSLEVSRTRNANLRKTFELIDQEIDPIF